MKPLDIDAVRRRMPARRIEYFETIDSTMHEAARLAAAGAPHGTAVAAGEQTAGLGRHGHVWHSEAGSGLYVSIVLRPRLTVDAMPVLTLAMGLAVAHAIARAASLPCDIRWPNDLMLGARKAAGVLVQLAGTAAVAGIGINVNHAGFPPELADLATSLRLSSGRPHSREDLLVELLPAVDTFCALLEREGRQAVIDLFSSRSTWARGKRVRAGAIEGVTAGLTPAGFLIVRDADGAEHVVLAGGVRALCEA